MQSDNPILNEMDLCPEKEEPKDKDLKSEQDETGDDPYQAPNPDLEVMEDNELPAYADAGSICQSITKGIFIISTAFGVLIALRNSLQWHIQYVWQASDDFWTAIWGFLCDIFDDNIFKMHIVGTVLIIPAIFWLANFFLLFLDTSMHPFAFWFRQFKIQQDKNVPVNPRKLSKCIKQVLFNQLCVTTPFLCAAHPFLVWRGMSISRELPDFYWSLVQLTVCVLVEEFCFYYSHRLMHHPRIYKYVHKVHHEWTAPIGIVSIYCHPIEFIVSNIGPLVVGVFVARCHLATAWFWYSIAVIQTTISHSGYHFPLLPSPEAHDFHHLKFNQNFGVLGVLDRLHGTDSLFRKTKAYTRHIMFFGLTPLSVQFPDEKKHMFGKEFQAKESSPQAVLQTS